MKSKILVSALVAVVVISAVAGLGISGHLLPRSTIPARTPVYLPEWQGIAKGINDTTAWATLRNVGNGTGVIHFAAVRENTGNWQTVANQTENLNVSPGSTATLFVTGNFSQGATYYTFDMQIGTSQTATSQSGGFEVVLN